MGDPSAHLLDRLTSMIAPAERAALAAVVAAAMDAGSAAYLVGGSVRDLLLGRGSPDLDITVVGDAPAIAREVARRLGLTAPVVHAQFRTATLAIEGRSLDLITARRESYAFPGALPTVTPATLLDDLTRRDFTINAMALGLTGADRGRLIDPYGGRHDLEHRVLRILHERSFRDDATRLLRAARYLARFRLHMAPDTAAAARRDRGYLGTISPARVRHELERIFAEADPARALAQVEALGLSDVLVPGLRYTASVLAAYRRLERDLTPRPPSLKGRGRDARSTPPLPFREGGRGVRSEPVAPWLLPVRLWSDGAIAAYADRFALTHRERVAAAALPEARRALTVLARHHAAPSAIVAALQRLPLATVVAWACFDPRTRRVQIAREYVTRLRHVRPLLSSAQLREMGVPEGPLFGEVVRRLRAARLDCPSLTLDAERALVHDILTTTSGA